MCTFFIVFIINMEINPLPKHQMTTLERPYLSIIFHFFFSPSNTHI